MHDPVAALVLAWLLGLLAVVVVSAFRTSSRTTQILALDTFTLLLAGVLAVFARLRDAAFYIDAAFVVSLVSFTATLAAAGYYARGPFLR